MAKALPLLHFSGRLRFDYPQYNNGPANPPVPFDPNLPAAQVRGITGGAPERYFLVEFVDVVVTGVTYTDGTSAATGDAVIGQSIALRGLLVDVAPSAIVAVLYAGSCKVGNTVNAKVARAFMSELRSSIKFADPSGGMQSLAAHFTAPLFETTLTPLPDSRWSNELGGDGRLAVRFGLNHFAAFGFNTYPVREQGFGDVYGVLYPERPEDAVAFRSQERRLLMDPEAQDDAVLADAFGANCEATYDVATGSRFVLLHALECLRFFDIRYATLASIGAVLRYAASVRAGDRRVEIGRFAGDHRELRQNGATFVFPLPDGVDPAALELRIEAVRASDGREFIVMSEPEWDLELLSDRGIKLGSRGSTEVAVRVLRANVPFAGLPVRFVAQPRNGRSPITATFEQETVNSGADGVARSRLVALDLAALPNVEDPVTGGPITALPLDRYAGHYVNAVIPNPRRDGGFERRETAVRVVHVLDPDALPAEPSFAAHIAPVLRLFVRYYPWLHTNPMAGAYRQFLNLASYDDVAEDADQILGRLKLDENQFKHMPRSRDLPLRFPEVFERWIDGGLLP